LTIFQNNIKRLLRDKFTLIVMFVLPIIFIAVSMFALSGNTPLNVVIIDNDNTKLTSILKEELGSTTNIVELEEQDIKQKLINGKLDYVIKIKEGFTKALIAGEDAKLETMSLKETNTSIPVKFFTESFVNSAKNIAVAAMGNEEQFYKGFELYMSNLIAADYSSIENTAHDTKENTQLSLGFMVMFMLFMSANAATLVLEDKHLRTYGRILSSPISTRSYFIQNLLSNIAIMFLQVCAIFFILTVLFKADMGPSIGNLLVLFTLFALTSVALGVAISSFSKDLRQDSAISYLLTIPMSMLGGCFWPVEIMPKVLQQLSNFTPVTWVLKASEKLLLGGTLTSIVSELGILMLFTLVFLILGSNRKLMKSS
jgi:ABC-2 type transport system permease protein